MYEYYSKPYLTRLIYSIRKLHEFKMNMTDKCWFVAWQHWLEHFVVWIISFKLNGAFAIERSINWMKLIPMNVILHVLQSKIHLFRKINSLNIRYVYSLLIWTHMPIKRHFAWNSFNFNRSSNAWWSYQFPVLLRDEWSISFCYPYECEHSSTDALRWYDLLTVGDLHCT